MINEYISKQKELLGIIIIGSILSIVTAAYQTYEYITTGYCGCSGAGSDIFNDYSVILGFIPVSLLGVIGVIITLGFALIYFLPYDRFNFTNKELPFDIPEKLFIYWFIYQSISLLIIVNLMYISYIIADVFCDLCFISQMVAIINWIIVFILVVKGKNSLIV